MDNIGPAYRSRGDLEADYAAKQRKKKNKMKSKVKPIAPEKITKKKEDFIPDEVIEAFNEIIVEKWNGTQSFFRTKEVVSKIKKKLKLNRTDKIYDNHWLDVEGIYIKLGWVVKYDSPCYGGLDFEPFFKFSKKEKK